MSAENLRRIADSFVAKLTNADRVSDPVGMLADFTAAQARNNAETVFFKVHTELGWTQNQAQELAENLLREHVFAIANVMHAHGATIEMIENLGRIAANAYGSRLAELAASYGQGGAA